MRTLESAPGTSQTGGGSAATSAVFGQLADRQGCLGDGNQAVVAAHLHE
jgi:hypothetical protein